MEIQFEKTVLPYMKTVTRQTQTQEQTQQVRLPDTMPDIGRILGGWGQLLLRGKEWRGNSIGVSGGVKAWVLYAPEEGGALQCVEAWLPFQMKWDIPQTDRDGVIMVCPRLRGVDARMLSDRKMMVRATVDICVQAMVSEDAWMYNAPQMPQDIQLLCNTYPTVLPVEAGEKAFEFEETLTLQSTDVPIDKLIRYALDTTLTEYKIVSDKLVMRGSATLRIAYLGTDGQLHHWQAELPISQYTQLDNAYSPETEAVVRFVVTLLDVEKADDNALQVKAGLTAEYVIFDRKNITVTEDVYSPMRSVDMTMEALQLPSVLSAKNQILQAEIPGDMGAQQMLDVVFYPENPQTVWEDGQRCGKMGGLFQLLYVDEEGQLQSTTQHWEDTWPINAAEDADVQITVMPLDMPQATATGVQVEIPLEMRVIAGQPLQMVAAIDHGDIVALDPNRPSLILRKADTDTLWQIARECGSTVDAIRKANGLQQEPHPGQMLLIPVS